VASLAWTTEIMFVIVSMILVSISSSGGKGIVRSEGLRDSGSGAGVLGIGGSDRNLDGSFGTQRPVGVPIVVKTDSHPNLSRIRTPSTVPEISPRTKYVVLSSARHHRICTP